MSAQLKLPMPAMLNLTEAEYNQHPGMRASHLKTLIQKSPAHYMESVLNPKEPTPAMRLGTDIHAAILEPERFMSEWIVSPKFDKRTKDGKAMAEEFALKNTGKRLMDPETHSIIQGVVSAVYAHPAAKKELSSGQAEVAYVWEDKETGIACKCKPDFVRADERVLVDVKTTADGSFKAFQRTIANLHYHVQAAYYLDGVSAVLGETFDIFRLVVVETAAPHAVAVYELDFGTLEKGRDLYRKALGIYQECTAMGVWPAYPDRIQDINLPAWAFVGDEE